MYNRITLGRAYICIQFACGAYITVNLEVGERKDAWWRRLREGPYEGCSPAQVVPNDLSYGPLYPSTQDYRSANVTVENALVDTIVSRQA